VCIEILSNQPKKDGRLGLGLKFHPHTIKVSRALPSLMRGALGRTKEELEEDMMKNE
jgi:hypothetical protein